jgi:hypothetical protein
MTDAERHACRRAARAAGKPATRIRSTTDRRSRVWRWRDAVAELTAVQAQCGAWLQALPTSLRESATAEALQEICRLDPSELQAVEPTRGFGRDWRTAPMQRRPQDLPIHHYQC